MFYLNIISIFLRNSELINENKNDESLVSFTEIKLDKLYKETRVI